MIRGIHRTPPVARVIYGIPLVEALAEEINRLDARAVYLMASGTLERFQADRKRSARSSSLSERATLSDGLFQAV